MKGGFLTLVLIVMVLPTVVSAAVIGRPANNLGLVAYWPLDEGRGTQAADVSGNKKHGVISGSPPWVAGQRGRAIQFGTSLNQYIDSGTIAALNNATRATTCAYIRKAAAGDQVSFGADNVTAFQGFGLEWASDGNVYFEADTDGSQYASVALPGAGWHHLCMVFDGSQAGNARLLLYVDGISQSASYNSTPPAALATNAQMGSFVIGSDISSGASVGTIDEVRLYSRALNATEVASLYRSGGSTFVSSSVSLSGDGLLKSGLVGHWTLDSQNVTTSIIDSSGNGNNGGFMGAATSSAKVAGKLGQALTFDGVDDYIQTPVNQVFTSGTFTAWVKLTTASPTDFASPIFNRTGGEATGISINASREIRYTWHNSIETWGFGTGLIVPTNEWVFMAASVNPTSATVYMYTDSGGLQSTTTVPASGHTAVTLNDLRLGTDTCCGGRYWRGPLDDLRVYNRALSRSEIQQLVNLGSQKLNTSVNQLQRGSSLANGLVGHWTFDNLDFTDKVYDKSGQGNDGYIGFGATSSVKVAGRLGQGANFGGLGKYVDVGNNAALKFSSGGFSASAWVYATSTATQMFLFHGLGCSNFSSWFLSIGGSENQNVPNKYAFGFNTADNGGTMVMARSVSNAFTGRWVHLVGTYDGSSVLSLYVDGTLVDSRSVSGNPYDNANRLYIGADSGCGRRFPAYKVDDVRVYGRELTASEAKALYNLGR